MDPLSITASSLAVLGALTAGGKGIQKLASLRHAGDDFEDLRHEAENLRGLLTLFREALLVIHGSTAYVDHGELLSTLLETAHKVVVDLESFVAFHLTKANEDTTLSKRRWLKASSQVEKLRQRIRDARSNLIFAVGVLSLKGGSQQTCQVQTLAITRPIHPAETNITRQEPSMDASAAIMEGSQDDDLVVSLPSRASEPSARHLPGPLAPHFNAIKPAACPKYCRCRCHRTIFWQSPYCLKSIFGQLLFSYNDLLATKRCDFPPCRNVRTRTNMT